MKKFKNSTKKSFTKLKKFHKTHRMDQIYFLYVMYNRLNKMQLRGNYSSVILYMNTLVEILNINKYRQKTLFSNK